MNLEEKNQKGTQKKWIKQNQKTEFCFGKHK